MVDVIQLYQSRGIFTKATYTPENRKLYRALLDSIDTTAGCLENGKLLLPVEWKSFPDFKGADLLVIQDTRNWESAAGNRTAKSQSLAGQSGEFNRDFILSSDRKLVALKQLSVSKPFEIFKLRKSVDDMFELELDYLANAMTIGIPERENHKLCDLKQAAPIRYKVNGKSDFTLTGRKERTFYEFDFILEWLGTADKVEFHEASKLRQFAPDPSKTLKLIDERKILV